MSDEGNISFVRLARKFFRSDLWNEPREYSRAEAWLDMIQSASFETETKLVDGCNVVLVRGELIASLRYLSSRWGWSKSKVERFLEMLTDGHRITTRAEMGIRVIRMCNYHRFNTVNKGWDSKRDADDLETGTQSGTPNRPPAQPVTPHGETPSGTLTSRKPGQQTGQSIRSTERTEEDPSPTARGWSSSELPSKEAAIAMTAPAAILPEFAAYVYDDWYGRGGKDGAGQPRDWLQYVNQRWFRERAEWIEGTHRGKKHGNNRKTSGQNRNTGVIGHTPGGKAERILAERKAREAAEAKPTAH